MTDWRAVLEWMRDGLLIWLEWGAGRIFSFSRRARDIRWVVLTAVLGIAWGGFALINARDRLPVQFETGILRAQVQYVGCTLRSAIGSDPNKFSKSQQCYLVELGRSYSRRPLIFELPFELLFAAGTFRHVLLAGFGAWLAFKLASEYLRGLHRLPDAGCGEHYLLQTALINPYNLLRIREGFVERADENLPIRLIGGPGRVRVHAENAALFEKMEGIPHVIGPTIDGRQKSAMLDGYERLRSIIDLRDQRDKFDVTGRSQDGIRVTAEDVQVVYSIFRNNQEPTYEMPYPFEDPEAVENLVYKQGSGPWNVAMGVQIRGELWDFYAKHALNEFLTMIDDPELKKQQLHEDQLNAVSRQLAGDENTQNTPPLVRIPDLNFVPRPDITEGFYKSAEERSFARGTQINWIGVGTWKFPAQLILGRHRDAWHITHDNEVKSKPVVLNTLRKQQRLAEVLRLIQTVPIASFRALKKDDVPAEDVMRGLVLAYHHQMNEAYQDYQREIEIAEMKLAQERSKPASAARDEEIFSTQTKLDGLKHEVRQIRQVLAFLARFTGRWL